MNTKFARFAVIGAIGFLLDASIFFMLVHKAGEAI